jgi:hypothetical protein
MHRAEICAANDFDMMDRFLKALCECGFQTDSHHEDASLGVGLSHFHRASEELTVYRDAWVVDLAGPEVLVNEVLACITMN